MPSPLSDLHITLLAPGEVVGPFTCGDEDLDDFLANDAAPRQGEHVVQTYLARRSATGAEVLGFVSLMADAVKLNTRERHRSQVLSPHPNVPAVKIARLGVCTPMQRAGIGKALVRFAFVTAQDVADVVGCRFLTLDAYPTKLEFYRGLGFVQNRMKDRKAKDGKVGEAKDGEQETISMRLDLFSATPPDWV